MSDQIEQVLADAAKQFSRYGSALGLDDFSTEDEAEEFRDSLSLRYPPEGYGTWSSRVRPLASGRFQVEWKVYSCE